MDRKGKKGTPGRLSRPRGARSRSPAAPPVLRGSALVTVDDSGRLKLPSGFRRLIEETWGHTLFLTSLTGESLWLYPLAVWQDKERKLLSLPAHHPSVDRFVARVSYFGAETELDAQGRLVVPGTLRAAARIEGEVAILGSLDHLEAWNNAVFRSRLEAEPWTLDDRRALAELGL